MVGKPEVIAKSLTRNLTLVKAFVPIEGSLTI